MVIPLDTIQNFITFVYVVAHFILFIPRLFSQIVKLFSICFFLLKPTFNDENFLSTKFLNLLFCIWWPWLLFILLSAHLIFLILSFNNILILYLRKFPKWHLSKYTISQAVTFLVCPGAALGLQALEIIAHLWSRIWENLMFTPFSSLQFWCEDEILLHAVKQTMYLYTMHAL